jgi:hypothetical protein
MVAQRKAMAEAAGDFASALHALSTVELSPTLSGPLDALSELQLTIRDVYDRQAQQDVLTLGIVIEEYIRLIGSVKQAFQQRQRSFYAWHAAEADLQKRKAAQDKLLRQGRSQQDRLSQVGVEVGEAEARVQHARNLFEDMGRLMRAELDRFEKEKVEDFKSGVETFLEGAVEAQKEVSYISQKPPFWRGIWFTDKDKRSSSKSGRRSSCNSTPRMTSPSSTGHPSCRRPTRAAATRRLTARGRGWTRIQTRRGRGLSTRLSASIPCFGSVFVCFRFAIFHWPFLCSLPRELYVVCTGGYAVEERREDDGFISMQWEL